MKEDDYEPSGASRAGRLIVFVLVAAITAVISKGVHTMVANFLMSRG